MLGIHTESVRKAWSYALVLGLLWGLFTIRATILSFALALMFAYLLYPAVEMIQQRLKLKKTWIAVALPFLAIMVILVTGFFLLRSPVLHEAYALRQQICSAEFKQRMVDWQPLGLPMGRKIAEGHYLNQLQSQIMRLMPQLGKSASRAGRDIANIFIIPILAFFMLKDGRRICDCLIDLCFRPTDRLAPLANRRMVVGILNDAHTLILQYMRSLVLLCFAVLVVFSVVLKGMGVQYALLLALFAFTLEFIPLVGPLVAGVVILLVSEFNQYPHLGWILAFLLAYRIFQDYVLSPHLMERAIKLHPLLVIFGVFAGGEIGGIGGIFLSVPLLAVARVVFFECLKREEKNFACDGIFASDDADSMTVASSGFGGSVRSTIASSIAPREV